MFFLLKKHKDQKYLNALQRFAGESDFLSFLSSLLYLNIELA